MLRARNAETLPVASNDAEDFDNLNDLLQHIGHTSPELLVEVSKPLNAIPSRRFLEDSIEQSCITGVLAQKQQTSDCSASAQRLITENQVILEEEDDTSLGSENSLQTDSQTNVSHSFQQARKLFSQLGFTSWEKRPDIHLLKKGDQLLRELKHLDAKKCRETHKIAVIYVAEGQEDKQSILSNSSGTFYTRTYKSEDLVLQTLTQYQSRMQSFYAQFHHTRIMVYKGIWFQSSTR